MTDRIARPVDGPRSFDEIADMPMTQTLAYLTVEHNATA